MAKEDVHIDAHVVHGAHILLELDGCLGEHARTVVHGFVWVELLAQIIPVAVEKQHHVLDLATLHDVLQILWQSTFFVPDVEDALDGDAGNAMLTGFFCLFLPFLDNQRLDGRLLLVHVTDTLRDIEACRRTRRRHVFVFARASFRSMQ